MKLTPQNLKNWLFDNIAVIIAVVVYICLKVSWFGLFKSRPLSVDAEVAISILVLMSSHVLKDRNDKVVLALSYLFAMLTPVIGINLSLAGIIFSKFLFERTEALWSIGLLLLCCVLESLNYSLGVELALGSAPIVLRYTISIAIALVALFSGRDKTVFLGIFAIYMSNIISFKNFGDTSVWVITVISLLSMLRISLLRALCALVIFISLVKGSVYLFITAFALVVLSAFSLKSKEELLPVIGIVSIGKLYPLMALLYFSILTVKFFSRSKVQAWLMKHHS